MNKQPIIFTDMDGTLLDHHTYSVQPAQAMLKGLKQAAIPVIANTSKTFAELTTLRKQIGLTAPFITENGAAVYIPTDFFPEQVKGAEQIGTFWCKSFSQPKHYWLSLLEQLDKRFVGLYEQFSKMTISRIAEVTGLNQQQAKQAAKRQYGEPLLWLGDPEQADDFIQELTRLGASPLIGGRFIHLIGQCDKGQAMQWLLSEFERQYPSQSYYSIALGDGQNDVAMLEAANIAVRIASPVNPLPKLLRQKDVYTSTLEGPAGWAECLQDILFSKL